MSKLVTGAAVVASLVGIVYVMGAAVSAVTPKPDPVHREAAVPQADDVAPEPARSGAGQASPPPEPITPSEPRWRFVRGENYVDYHLVQRSGPAVAGRQFEDGVMCRNVFEATDENMWAMTHLVITYTQPEMTSFMGMIGNQIVEVTLVKDLDRNAPSYLTIGGLGIIGSCEQSLG